MITHCWNCKKACEEDIMSIDPTSGNLHSRVCPDCRKYLLSTLPEEMPYKEAKKILEGWPDPSELWMTREETCFAY